MCLSLMLDLLIEALLRRLLLIFHEGVKNMEHEK